MAKRKSRLQNIFRDGSENYSGMKISRAQAHTGSIPVPCTGLKGESIMCQCCKAPSIPVNILNKLPKGGEFLGFSKSKEAVDHGPHEIMLRHVVAIKWAWQDRFSKRCGLFSLETGDYLEEC